MGDRTKNIGEGVPANHAARAVDINEIWPEIPAGDLKRKKAAADAGARGTSASPMDPEKRVAMYFASAQTPRQRRRLAKKLRAQGV